MSRYRRVNIDGESLFKTETRKLAANTLPGTFVYINNDDEFVVAPAGTVGRLYAVESGYHEGLGIRDAIPADHSAVGNYVEEGREMAILMPAGTYKKDQPIAVGSSGRGVASATNVIGWAQDDVTISSEDFIRIRFRTTLNTAAVASVEVTPATASIAVAATVQLTATVLPGNANSGITWTTSDATKATVSATGLVTGVAAGSATITATSTSDGTKTDTAAITVTS